MKYSQIASSKYGNPYQGSTRKRPKKDKEERGGKPSVKSMAQATKESQHAKKAQAKRAKLQPIRARVESKINQAKLKRANSAPKKTTTIKNKTDNKNTTTKPKTSKSVYVAPMTKLSTKTKGKITSAKKQDAVSSGKNRGTTSSNTKKGSTLNKSFNKWSSLPRKPKMWEVHYKGKPMSILKRMTQKD